MSTCPQVGSMFNEAIWNNPITHGGGGGSRGVAYASTVALHASSVVWPEVAVFTYWTAFVPAAHWWVSGNVKLGLIGGSFVHCDVFVLVCCAFCMLGNVHSMFLEVLDTHLVKVQGGGFFFWRRLS